MDESESLTQALEQAANQIESGGTPSGDFFVLGKVTSYDLDDDADVLYEFFFDDWTVLENTLEVDELVSCYKEPRGGMFTYNYTLAAVTLPSGRRLYLEWGDTMENAAVGLARAGAPATADMHFIKLHGTDNVDLPFEAVGDELFQIDVLWGMAEPAGSFIRDALEDWGASWMPQEMLDDDEERRNALEQALDEALAEEEINEEDYGREIERLGLAPPWFHTLTDEKLDWVAALPLPAPDRDPPVDHQFATWQRPTADMFTNLDDPVNLQHVAAAWIAGGFS
jgi:hypothetical protein